MAGEVARKRSPMTRFGEVFTAMVTPFDANGALDLDAAQTLAKWLVDRGNDGLVVAGQYMTAEGEDLRGPLLAADLVEVMAAIQP